VTRRLLVFIPFLLAASTADYVSSKKKVDLIESGRLAPGTRVEFAPAELNAWAEHEVPEIVPQGVRNPHLNLGQQRATGTALVDFGKLQRAQGSEPGWLMSKLLDGEHPVSVTARIQSSGGQATIDLEKVEISGMAIDGPALDFLIRNFLLPMYPNATVGRPFALGNRIEKLDVRPAAVGVLIGR
jgi:hypothetical protein